MTLLEYVISNDEEIPIKKAQSEFYKQALEDFIMEGYCPSYFDVVKGTVYEAPLNPTRTDKKQCKKQSESRWLSKMY